VKPVDLPPASSFAHGTRSRYVADKCRCAACREANRLYYHERQARMRARLGELVENEAKAEALLGPAPVQPAPQLWTAPDGTQQVRIYARLCPGLRGPCPTGSHLRKDSKGNLCGGCRERLAFNGNVTAERAREHLLELAKLGVGRRAVAAASDVSQATLAEIKRGTKLFIRADTERRILAIDAGAAADHALVKAGPTWKAIAELRRMGWTKGRISQALGNQVPALQLRKRHVLARTELAVRQLLERAKEERLYAWRCPRCGQSHAGDKFAADWCRKHPHVPLDALEGAA
jgi:rubrerythrin